MKKQHTIMEVILAVCLIAVVGIAWACRDQVLEDLQHPAAHEVAKAIAGLHGKARPQQPKPKRKAPARKKPLIIITGTVRDTAGIPLPDVVVSDGYSCTKTDTAGQYKMARHEKAKFIFYTVPDYCEVTTHSEADHTACFYQPVADSLRVYDFTLTRLPNGKETSYRMIVIGDPQITNAMNPYYTRADENAVQKSDLERFTSQTMTDIRRTIRRLPKGAPVYGLSMGDNVQYYGGYNEALERQMRQALGDSDMRLFSVIGNHDNDGRPVYVEKWEEQWGPTDYSFDRGDQHYVCLNNVHYTRRGGYYSPGELTDDQMRWLRQDLALADKQKQVVLCYHVPFTFGPTPQATSKRLGALLALLKPFRGGYQLFCGHTHFAVIHEIQHQGQPVMEHCHAAACGNIWQSNINLCGTPNGYYIYTFDGIRMGNAQYKGTFWEADKQMTLFRADTDFNGESYAADWNLPTGRNILIANVFNADSRWKVEAIEEGRDPQPMQRLSGRNQDAFATGYHHRFAQATPYHFVGKQNTYLIMNHLFYYEPQHPDVPVTVRATDPYGNVYTASSSEVITEPFMNFAHYYKNGK